MGVIPTQETLRRLSEDEQVFAQQLLSLLQEQATATSKQTVDLIEDIAKAFVSLSPSLSDLHRGPEAERSFWKACGFQRPDPLSDVRGGGLLSLIILEEMLRTDAVVFQMHYNQLRGLRNRTEAVRSFPFAAASINLTRVVVQLLGLVTEGGAPVALSEVRVRSSWFPTRFEEVVQMQSGLMAAACEVGLGREILYMEFNSMLGEIQQTAAKKLAETSSAKSFRNSMWAWGQNSAMTARTARLTAQAATGGMSKEAAMQQYLRDVKA